MRPGTYPLYDALFGGKLGETLASLAKEGLSVPEIRDRIRDRIRDEHGDTVPSPSEPTVRRWLAQVPA